MPLCTGGILLILLSIYTLLIKKFMKHVLLYFVCYFYYFYSRRRKQILAYLVHSKVKKTAIFIELPDFYLFIYFFVEAGMECVRRELLAGGGRVVVSSTALEGGGSLSVSKQVKGHFFC